MSKRRDQKDGFRDRFWVWMKANEKVVWVMLLALISFTFAFPVYNSAGSRSSSVRERIFGREITEAEVDSVQKQLPQVFNLGRPLFVGESFGGYAFIQYRTLAWLNLSGRRNEANAEDFFLFVEAAQRLGLRVSDAELGRSRRRLYYHHLSTERALKQLSEQGLQPPRPDDFQALREYEEKFSVQADEIRLRLEAEGGFDPDEWRRIVARFSSRRVHDVEEDLRRLLVLAKLDDYVLSTVKVTQAEVWDKFREEFQRRKLSWVKLEEPAGIRDAIAKELTEEDIKQRYERNASDFMQKSEALRFDYVRAERAPFEAEVAASFQDEDLAKAYKDYREDFVRPGFRGDAGYFVLQTPEEKAAREMEIYLPLEEVKEKVRQRLIRERAEGKLKELAEAVKKRLYPQAEPGKPAPLPAPGTKIDLEALKKDFPALEVASRDYATRSEAPEKFKPVYEGGPFATWFQSVEKDKALKENDLKRLQEPYYSLDELEEGETKPYAKAFVFYANVEFRDEGPLRPEEARKKVEAKLIQEQLRSLLGDALRSEVKKLRDAAEAESAQDPAKFAEATGRLLGELQKKEVEISLPGGAKFQARFGPVEDSKGYIARANRSGSLQVPKKEEEKKGKSAKSEETWPPPSEPHPDSKDILNSVFLVEKPGDVTVAVTVTETEDKDDAACYAVRFIDLVHPDPGKFEGQRSSVERLLLEERRQNFFVDWRNRLRREALDLPEIAS
jgi:hypothetical protein